VIKGFYRDGFCRDQYTKKYEFIPYAAVADIITKARQMRTNITGQGPRRSPPISGWGWEKGTKDSKNSIFSYLSRDRSILKKNIKEIP
jgi:hypothetical protein